MHLANMTPQHRVGRQFTHEKVIESKLFHLNPASSSTAGIESVTHDIGEQVGGKHEHEHEHKGGRQ